MFFQEPTPDTSGYMIAGYAITFIVMAIYVASMYLRSRNLNQDMTTLRELETPAPPVQPAIGVAVSIGVSLSSLILSTRIIDLLRTRNDLTAKNAKGAMQESLSICRRGVWHKPFLAPPQLHRSN